MPTIIHFELEGNGRLGIPKEMLRYNVLTAHPHDLPVVSLLILLRKSALASDMNGTYIRRDGHGALIVVFRYHIEKVWERSVDHWLNAGAGLAPLALLTDEAEGGLDNALDRLWESLHDPGVERKIVHEVFGSSFILCGMRYGNERLLEAFGRYSMLLEESTTYQYLIKKGMDQGSEKGLKAFHRLVLHNGTKRFGCPNAENLTLLHGIRDIDRLENLGERVLDVQSWEELLKE